MPQIREYISQVKPVGPQDFAKANEEHFGSNVGQGLQRLAGGVEAISDRLRRREESDETMRAKLELMKVRVEAQNRLREGVQNGNINYEELKTEFNNKLRDINDSLGLKTKTAKQFFELESAELGAYLDTKSFDAEADIKGIKAVNNFEELANLGIQSINSDPSITNLENINASLELILDQKVHKEGLAFDKAEILKKRGREQNLKVFLSSNMNVNPYSAKSDLASGKWDTLFTSDENKQIWSNAIDKMIKAREQEAEEIRKQKQSENSDALFNKLINTKEKNNFSQSEFVKEIMEADIPTYGVGGKDWFLKQLENEAKQVLNKSDSTTFNLLYRNIHLDSSDPNRIKNPNEIRKYMGTKLSAKDTDYLIKELKIASGVTNPYTKSLIKTNDDWARSLIVKRDPMTGLEDPQGLALYSQYIKARHEWVQEAYERGVPMNKIYASDGNPDSVYNININPYVRSMGERINAQFSLDKNEFPLIEAENKKRPKRLPGESAADYMERIGGM